jgi:hypothetical protein
MIGCSPPTQRIAVLALPRRHERHTRSTSGRHKPLARRSAAPNRSGGPLLFGVKREQLGNHAGGVTEKTRFDEKFTLSANDIFLAFGEKASRRSSTRTGRAPKWGVSPPA